MRDGRIVAAASEERFTRKKHDPAFPLNAVQYCLKESSIEATDLDYIGFYDKPFVKFERLMLTYCREFPRGLRSFLAAVPSWLKEKMWIRAIILEQLGLPHEARDRVLFADHHMSHAASAFLVSPFDEAAILTVDGVGEWSTTTRGVGRGTDIELFDEIRFPHSLGLLYSAVTGYLGFRVNSAEYKVMGLAPYGEPKYVDQVRQLIDIKDDGSFALDMSYFAYTRDLKMTNDKFARLFDHAPYPSEEKPTQHQMDIAASVQAITEEVMLKSARALHERTGISRLCLAGGVALNCIANGRLLRESPFDDIWIQPAAGDAGGAIGMAAHIWYTALDNPRDLSAEASAKEEAAPMSRVDFGPSYSDEDIRAFLDSVGANYTEHDREDLIETTADLIAEQNVVGWFQGRMEFGPRALGHRSILADPRNPKAQDTINLKIKFRESFRPFAPSVLLDKANEWFDFDTSQHTSPYMLFTCPVADGREIPAVTHVDGSARIQTVAREDNALYYDLIAAFDKRTGCPVVVNTSFNVRGEPIVCTPQDAYDCFTKTNMDALVIDRFILRKAAQSGD